MDAAQILKPFANEHIPADTKETATAEHTSVIITMQNVNKSYKMGSGSLHVLKDISLTVEQGEYLAILGPSGSGKSTLMNIIGCMDVLDEGTYNLDGVEIEKAKEKELTNIRNQKIGFIFQKYHLIPTYNVLQNIVMPLLMRGMTLKDARDASMDTIAMLGLAERIDHKPNELSGGQQQRVAIARALANEPKVLLLDEPLSALDLKLRKDMQNELKKIQQAIGITFIFVTHDQEEALSMSDTVVVMDKGEIQQIGSPIDIYNEPKNAFVADFIGESNILDGTMIEDYLVEVAGQRFKSLDSGFGKMAPVDVVIRPEDIDIVPTGSAAAHINGVVTSVTFKGVHYEIIVDVDGFKWMIQTTDSANVGDKIGLALTPDDIHVMAKSVYSGTMGDYSTFSDEMEEALQEEGSEHED